VESVLAQEETTIGKICETCIGFKQEVKIEGVMDDESDESTEEDDATGVGRGESEVESLG